MKGFRGTSQLSSIQTDTSCQFPALPLIPLFIPADVCQHLCISQALLAPFLQFFHPRAHSTKLQVTLHGPTEHSTKICPVLDPKSGAPWSCPVPPTTGALPRDEASPLSCARPFPRNTYKTDSSPASVEVGESRRTSYAVTSVLCAGAASVLAGEGIWDVLARPGSGVSGYGAACSPEHGIGAVLGEQQGSAVMDAAEKACVSC